MEEKRSEFLKELYDYQVTGNKRGAGMSISNEENYHERLSILKYWEEKGYIDVIAETGAFVDFKLTAFGIDYVENELL